MEGKVEFNYTDEEDEDKWLWLKSLKPMIRVVIIIFLISLIKMMVR